MFNPIFKGQQYSYSYEAETKNYLLFENSHKNHTFLKGKDARLFQKQIAHYCTLSEIENLIKFFL